MTQAAATEAEDPLVFVRDAKRSDHKFIENAWRSTMNRGMDREFFERHEFPRLFRNVMTFATVRVVCDSADHDNLCAFAISDGPLLIYVYVASAFRHTGLVPLLLKDTKITSYAFTSQPGRDRLKFEERGWKYTPRWTWGT